MPRMLWHRGGEGGVFVFLRISIEMAAFSMENSTENAAVSIKIRGTHRLTVEAWGVWG